jgi:hypothetical protein
MMKSFISGAAAIAALGGLSGASAAEYTVTLDAADFTLIQYGNSSLIAFGVTSHCTYGAAVFPSGATDDTKNRFYAAVTTLALADRAIIISYNYPVGGNCEIFKFSY